MPDHDKKNFILRKRHLPLRELAAQTGLTEEEVARILGTKKEPEALSSLPLLRLLWEERVAYWGYLSLLVLAVLLFYLPVLHNDFVNWDDKDAILENPEIRQLDWAFLKWSVTTFATGNWMPLTWLSFALNYQMSGLSPQAFHVTNVILHALNTVLVFLISRRVLQSFSLDHGASSPSSENFVTPITIFGRSPISKREMGVTAIPANSFQRIQSFATPISFLTALLFGLHPIHVESVAWAVERKDVLYSFFYLWSLYLYLGHATFPRPSRATMAGSLFLYFLSLLSKPMAITLPFVFLIFDAWPLQKLQKDFQGILREKIPFFLLAAASGIITFISHLKTLTYANSGLEFYWILNSFRAPLFYLVKMAWPSGLCGFYPFPQFTWDYVLVNFGAAALVLGICLLLLRYRRQAPYLLAAWVFYLVTLAPVLGFIQTGTQAAADRYSYLASLGFFLPASAALAWVFSYRRLPYLAVTLLLGGLLGFLTVRQIGTWKNTQLLWERVTTVYPDENADNYDRLGAAYLKAHRYDEAVVAFSRAASIPPYDAHTFQGLGAALVYKDRIPEAITAYEYALKLDPGYNPVRVNLWKVYEHLGEHEQAIAQIAEAVRREPASPAFLNDLGVSCGALKKYPEAKRAFTKAHELDPAKPEYLVNLATICQWEGNIQEALDWYRKGIAKDPHEPVYFLKRGDLYLAQDRKKEALESLRMAWKLNPTTAKVAQQMGEDFEKLGEMALAQQCYEKARELSSQKPNEPKNFLD